MQNITLDYILNHKFEKTGLESDYSDKFSRSGRFAPSMLSSLPDSDEDKMAELKTKLERIDYDKAFTNAKFEAKTNIKKNSFRKALNGGPKRKIQRVTVAKFAVGLKLSLNEADKLFALESQPLAPNIVLLDAVVVHCINEHHDIDEFFETCEQVGLNVKAAE